MPPPGRAPRPPLRHPRRSPRPRQRRPTAGDPAGRNWPVSPLGHPTLARALAACSRARPPPRCAAGSPASRHALRIRRFPAGDRRRPCGIRHRAAEPGADGPLLQGGAGPFTGDSPPSPRSRPPMHPCTRCCSSASLHLAVRDHVRDVRRRFREGAPGSARAPVTRAPAAKPASNPPNPPSNPPQNPHAVQDHHVPPQRRAHQGGGGRDEPTQPAGEPARRAGCASSAASSGACAHTTS